MSLLALAVTGLVLQPDFGQTMLVALVWSALFFLAGMRLVWVAGLGGAAAVGLATANIGIARLARKGATGLSRENSTVKSSTALTAVTNPGKPPNIDFQYSKTPL